MDIIGRDNGYLVVRLQDGSQKLMTQEEFDTARFPKAAETKDVKVPAETKDVKGPEKTK